MSFKKVLKKLSKKELEKQEEKVVKEEILLDKKIDAFIDWYSLNMVNGKYTDIGEYFEPKKMRYAIDKMTAWFELRYSENDINRLFKSNKDKRMSSNEVMFKYNPYIKELMGENSDIECFDWNEFYSFNCYLKNLNWDEKWMLLKHSYPGIVYFGEKNRIKSPHFHLYTNGIIMTADDVDTIIVDNHCLCSDDFEGKHINDAYSYLKNLDISIDLREIEFTIKNYNNFTYMKEELLNCVMYNIIERGGNRIGPRRGLIFAKEFGRDISIPIKYGIDYKDSDLKEFINAYIKLGGSVDIECIDDYFYRNSDNYTFGMINLKDVLKELKYTGEEKELHQKFVNVIKKRVNTQIKIKKLVK